MLFSLEPQILVLLAFSLVFALSCHEFAHAYVADRFGDPTARMAGRLTVNPMVHLDVFGSLMVLVAGFGYAKPVPVNPRNFRQPRADAFVAAAGPLAGILGIERRPLVSADYARDSRSSIVDAPSTMVTDGTLLKIYAWYDNEMGYSCRMVDLANRLIAEGL